MRRDNGHGLEETRTFGGLTGRWIGKPLSRKSGLSPRQQETTALTVEESPSFDRDVAPQEQLNGTCQAAAGRGLPVGLHRQIVIAVLLVRWFSFNAIFLSSV